MGIDDGIYKIVPGPFPEGCVPLEEYIRMIIREELSKAGIYPVTIQTGTYPGILTPEEEKKS